MRPAPAASLYCSGKLFPVNASAMPMDRKMTSAIRFAVLAITNEAMPSRYGKPYNFFSITAFTGSPPRPTIGVTLFTAAPTIRTFQRA